MKPPNLDSRVCPRCGSGVKSYMRSRFANWVCSSGHEWKWDGDSWVDANLIKKQAGVFDGIQDVVADAYSAVRPAFNQAGEAVTNFLDAPTAADLANADAKGIALAVADAGGNPTNLSLSPDPMKYTWDTRLRRLFENPQNKTRAALLGGGVLAGSAFSGYLWNRANRRRHEQVKQELSRMGLKTSNSPQLKQAGFAEIMEKVKDIAAGVGESATTLASDAGGGIGSKLKEYAGLIREGLDNPEMRPYVAAGIGAAVGGGGMATLELASKRRKRRVLSALVSGGVGGALVGGAGGYLTKGMTSGAPDAPDGDSFNVRDAAREFLRMDPASQSAGLNALDQKIQSVEPTMTDEAMAAAGAAAGAAGKAVVTNPTIQQGAGAVAAGHATGAAIDQARYQKALRKTRMEMRKVLNKNPAGVQDIPKPDRNSFTGPDRTKEFMAAEHEYTNSLNRASTADAARAKAIQDVKARRNAIVAKGRGGFGGSNKSKMWRRTAGPLALLGLGKLALPGIRSLTSDASEAVSDAIPNVGVSFDNGEVTPHWQ